jgi:hypothetical protein
MGEAGLLDSQGSTSQPISQGQEVTAAISSRSPVLLVPVANRCGRPDDWTQGTTTSDVVPNSFFSYSDPKFFLQFSDSDSKANILTR